MSDTKTLKQESLGALFGKLRAGGRRILAPCRSGEQIVVREVQSPSEMADDYIQTSLSAKAAVFPPCEELFRYSTGGKNTELKEPVNQAVPTVVFGIRPCDAASFAVLNSVFTWDYQDRFFKEKLAKLTVIGIACTKADEYCFCTSLNGGPGDTRGSDILLTPLGQGRYLAEILTSKGQEIVAMAPELFGPAEAVNKEERLAKVPRQFELKVVEERLPALFDKDEVWLEQSLRCLGCGACAFVCPTCVCFDIQDEKVRQDGRRVRCWDSCGLGLFTLHTSGHNPRSRQGARWRQRVMHKFSYFRERLGVVGCVGCGRCIEACLAKINIYEDVNTIKEEVSL